MSCNTVITQGRTKVCKSSIGGNGVIYFYNSLADAFTYANGIVTAMNVNLTEAFAYDLEGDLNTLVESIISNRNTGTLINTQTLVVSLKQINASTSAEMNLLAKSYPQAVVKDRNGVYHCLGLDDGMDFQIDQVTGGAKTDFNGYTLTGIATTSALSPKLDASTITAFLAIVAPSISGPITVAVGSSIILYGSGLPAAATTWVSGTPAKATVVDNNTNSVYVTGVATGTTVITYTDLSGQTATLTVTVTA